MNLPLAHLLSMEDLVQLELEASYLPPSSVLVYSEILPPYTFPFAAEESSTKLKSCFDEQQISITL